MANRVQKTNKEKKAKLEARNEVVKERGGAQTQYKIGTESLTKPEYESAKKNINDPKQPVSPKVKSAIDSRVFPARDAKVEKLRQVRDIRGEVAPLETFEQFKERPVQAENFETSKELTEFYKAQGFTDEEIQSIEEGNLNTGIANPVTPDDVSTVAGAVTGIGALAKGGSRLLAKGLLKDKLAKTSAKKTTGVIKGGWQKLGAIAGFLALAGVDPRGAFKVPQDRIDSMESQAGKMGEASAELVNLAKGGRPEQALVLAREMLELTEAFDAQAYELSQRTLSDQINPEEFDNIRFEFFKTRNEIIATMDEIERFAVVGQDLELEEYQSLLGEL